MITRDILGQALSAWLRVEAEQVPADAVAAWVPHGPFVGRRQVWLRRLVFAILRHLEQTRQIQLTDALKRIRRASGGPALWDLSAVLEAMRCVKEELAAAGLPVDREPGRVCFSHDIDWIECQEYAPVVAALETAGGVNASYMFLTDWNYRLDHGLIRSLAAAGFEIGLHGTNHDIALAHRSPQHIRRVLQQGLDAMPVAVQGYRAPALSRSPALFAALAQVGFGWDSSVPVGPAPGQGLGLCLPLVFASGLVELPITLQDSSLFRDGGLDDAQALETAVALMRQIVDLGGLFVFNGHPGILRRHMDFFKGLLDAAQAYQVQSMAQAVAHWQNRLGGVAVL